MNYDRRRAERTVTKARDEAIRSRDRGVQFAILVDGIELDVTTLAWIEPRDAAAHWIARTARSVAKTYTEDRMGELVLREHLTQGMWSFWRGEDVEQPETPTRLHRWSVAVKTEVDETIRRCAHCGLERRQGRRGEPSYHLGDEVVSRRRVPRCPERV